MYAHARMYAHADVQISVRVYTRTRVCTRICTRVLTYVIASIYTHTRVSIYARTRPAIRNTLTGAHAFAPREPACLKMTLRAPIFHVGAGRLRGARA